MKAKCSCGNIIDWNKTVRICDVSSCTRPLIYKSMMLCEQHNDEYAAWFKQGASGEPLGNRTVERWMRETGVKGS